MGFSELLIVVFLFVLAWYWFDGMRSKELATRLGTQACKRAELDFLDETVVLTKIKLLRNENGRMQIYRWYQFEFTSDGSSRYKGDIELLGKQLINLNLEPHRMPA